MGLFRREVDFWDGFARLNALNGFGLYGWETPTARKEHIDEFGVEIKPGETYFRRKTGPSYNGFIAMSRDSMEKIVYALIYSSPPAEMACEELRKKLLLPLPSEAGRYLNRPGFSRHFRAG